MNWNLTSCSWMVRAPIQAMVLYILGVLLAKYLQRFTTLYSSDIGFSCLQRAAMQHSVELLRQDILREMECTHRLSESHPDTCSWTRMVHGLVLYSWLIKFHLQRNLVSSHKGQSKWRIVLRHFRGSRRWCNHADSPILRQCASQILGPENVDDVDLPIRIWLFTTIRQMLICWNYWRYE